jgi:hypothetical protein
MIDSLHKTKMTIAAGCLCRGADRWRTEDRRYKIRTFETCASSQTARTTFRVCALSQTAFGAPTLSDARA